MVCSIAVHATSKTVLQEELWLNQASVLIKQAETARADAKQFNQDVRDSRARLREYIREAKNAELSAEHRALHSTMVLLDVLLKSAAACQTAGHIVCPPLLMSQLKTVKKNAYANLEKIKQTLD